MGSRNQTDLVEEVRLPAGGSFIITDEVGHELFRVTAVGDQVKVSGSAVAAGTQHAHIADPAGAVTDTDAEARTAIVAILDALEAFGIAAAS